jgi:N-acyl-D-amino-acid deacylase
MKYDLLITNGLVVDGTGLPRRRADVAIRDGRIAGIGQFDESLADKVIDAKGRIVAPGIIDPHTHYDPQLTFDPAGQGRRSRVHVADLHPGGGYGARCARGDPLEF